MSSCSRGFYGILCINILYYTIYTIHYILGRLDRDVEATENQHMSADQIALLPTVVYTPSTNNTNSSNSSNMTNISKNVDESDSLSGNVVDAAKCTICLSEFTTGEVLKSLPCEDMYHEHCISNWLTLHNTCPICKLAM